MSSDDRMRRYARQFAKEYWAEAFPKYSERFDSDAGDDETTLKVAESAFRWLRLKQICSWCEMPARPELVDGRVMAECPVCRTNEELRGTLFDAIKHGDEEHQSWLKEAIDKHFSAADTKAES